MVRRADEQRFGIRVVDGLVETRVAAGLVIGIAAKALERGGDAGGGRIEYAVYPRPAEQRSDAHVLLADGARADDPEPVPGGGFGVEVAVLGADMSLARAVLEVAQAWPAVAVHRLRLRARS